MPRTATPRRILAVIPMRSGSRGVPDKNVRDLKGRPLFTHILGTLKSVDGLAKIIVSTDSERYADMAREAGAEVPFLRPDSLADPMTRLHHVLAHALAHFDAAGQRFGAVLSAQATAPLVLPRTVEGVIHRFHETNCQAVATSSQIGRGHPYLAKILDPKTGQARDFLDLPVGTARYPRQVRPELHSFNGALFLRDRTLLETPDDDKNALGDSPLAFPIADHEALNIDTEQDFRLAEFLMQDLSR